MTNFFSCEETLTFTPKKELSFYELRLQLSDFFECK